MSNLAGSSTNGLRTKILFWAGNLIAVACLLWALKHAKLSELGPELMKIDWRWIVLASLTDISVYFAQGWRWTMLMSPVAKVRVTQTIRSIYVGLFANEILPLRTGEVIRCYLMARWNNLPFSVIVSSALIERIFDGIWLIVLTFATARFVKLPKVVDQLLIFLVILVAILAGALALIVASKETAHRWVAQSNATWKQRLVTLIDDVHAMGKSPTFLGSFFASTAYILLQAGPIYAIVRGYGFSANDALAPTAVLMVVLRLGTIVPNAPGNIGTFQVLAGEAFAVFVDRTTAYQFAFILWGVVTLPLLIGGFIALAMTGLKLGELQKEAQAIAGAPEATPAQ
jgi:uncharacterized protein (TIRG00374 family)